MPRNVRAPITPSARGRAWPSNRCDAAAVPTGTRIPPPTPWTMRPAISWSIDWAAPATNDPIVNSPSAARSGRRAPQTSAIRPASGIATMKASR